MIHSIKNITLCVFSSIILLFACEPRDDAASSYDPDGASVVTISEVPGEAMLQREDRRLSLSRFQLSHTPFANEECCTEPGEISGCWWEDADSDGVTCSPDKSCPNNQSCNYDLTGPSGQGLCECRSNSDCNDGNTRQGVCNTDLGVCGPSYCNGFLVCACWGGCKPGGIAGYDSPESMCKDVQNGYAGYCCEGAYPRRSDGAGFGFCANENCAMRDEDCDSEADCDDGNPCTANRCENGLCQFPAIDGDVPESPGCNNLAGELSADCAVEWCVRGSCAVDFSNENGDCEDNPQGVDPAWYGNGPRSDDMDTTSCYFQKCDGSGRCVARSDLSDTLHCDDASGNPCESGYCAAGACHHDPSDHIGVPCNGDDNACTVDRCDAFGACVSGEVQDCDDANWCTFPDACTDEDPNHIVWTCENPPRNGDATDFGYSDPDHCSDIVCLAGFEASVSTDCAAHNPEGYDLQCNRYSCIDGNGEDNCTLSYADLIGEACDDGDPCTVGDTCQDGGGFGVCRSGAEKNCDDGNDCTADSCISGECENAIRSGAGCDVDPCTVDTCNVSGICVKGPPLDCSGETTACANGVCNPSTGECEPDYLVAGTSCDADGNACTVDDACDGNGRCIADTEIKDCSGMDDACNTGVCNPTTGDCERDPIPHEGAPCNRDNSDCTPNDTCQSGVCVADAPVDCSGMEDQCNRVTCDPGTGDCVYDNDRLLDAPCNLDDSGCTVETCQGPAADGRLTCTPVSTVSCSDGNECTADSCESLTWNTYQCNNTDEPVTASCNFDDDGCTRDDHCDSGACVKGVTVTAAACESALGVDTDCNTAVCVDDSVNSYHCEAVVKSTSPGSCDLDGDGCTLDECVDSGDPAVGAECMLGDERDCSGLNNLPCVSGVCLASNPYDSSCDTVKADSSTSCSADGDGCTQDDHCDDGACVKGDDAVCSPPDDCHTSACRSTGDNSYECDDTPVADCCLDVSDCADSGLGCIGTPLPPDGCSQLACVDNECVCNHEAADSACIDYNDLLYPTNCYDGECDGAGTCDPVSHTANNNLCSDLFDAAAPASLNTSHVGYLGTVPVGGIAGSTTCANNNYNSIADTCTEKTSGNDLGTSGNDVVYVFEYPTNTANDYQLYSYVIKVHANFEVGVYVETGISTANDCPEGNRPADDASASAGVSSKMCAYPYKNTVAPPAIEEQCALDGNALRDQECCDPCIEGASCGFKWCKRGYENDGTSCDMCDGAGGAGYDPWTHTGDCDTLWTYPDDPFDCESETPMDAEYDDYEYMAVATVSPEGDTDGSPRHIFVFIDGIGGASGNFYLTVERQPLQASPCARANDDTRVYDITDVGAAGQTFLGTLDGVVNSEPATGGACGGHDCATWPSPTGCHQGGYAANEFWPNREYFKIHRNLADGDQTYCIQTDESVDNAADLTIVGARRTDSQALTICSDAYTPIDCRHDDAGGNVEWEFTAGAGELYLFSLSQWGYTNRPCNSALGDDCHYALTVTEGPCPSDCVDPQSWYGAAVNGVYTVEGVADGFSPDSIVDGDTSDSSNDYDIHGGWGGNDELWRIDVLENSYVLFSGCWGGGYGWFDGQMALFDCQGDQVMWNDDGCGRWGMPHFAADLYISRQPYYLLVDGYGWRDDGSYGISMTYLNTCYSYTQNGDETDVDCGGAVCAPCAEGQTCIVDSDCESDDCTGGVCAATAGCSEATATDLGGENNWVTVSNDACVMVRDHYPAHWNNKFMWLKTKNGGNEYPLPFHWSNSCSGRSDDESFSGNQMALTTDYRIDDSCATVIELQGSGSRTVKLRYTGVNHSIPNL